MITKTVKTLYKGMAGVPDKVVNEAMATGDGLGIWHDGDLMELSTSDLTAKRITIGAEVYSDKFGGADYRLYYYVWKPTIIQKRLFEGGAYAQ